MLKDNIEKECDAEMAVFIRDKIVGMVVSQEQGQVCVLVGGRGRGTENAGVCIIGPRLFGCFREATGGDHQDCHGEVSR